MNETTKTEYKYQCRKVVHPIYGRECGKCEKNRFDSVPCGNHLNCEGCSWKMERCSCGGEFEFSNYCGAWVCQKCKKHRGLSNCFCGWNRHLNPHPEDDIGTAKFDGKFWDVDY